MKNIKAILLASIIAILFSVFCQNLQAAYLKNVPVTLTQPDGSTLNCFASGDEYYSWLHDQNNYTIVQNHQNGFYVYAEFIDGELAPTPFIAGKADPQKAGLFANANIPAQQILQLRESFWKNTPSKPILNQQHGVQNTPQQTLNQGTINNLVIYIRFSDEAEYTDLNSVYDNMFNGVAGTSTMKNYFEEVSNNTLHITTTYYPKTTGTTVISYKDSQKRDYYQKYNSTTNTNGYQSNNRTSREQTLLKNAVDYVATQVPGTLNLDYNNDGYVDNVCFVISGAQGGWSDLLWPHRWALYSTTANINGKRVWDYNFQLRDFLQNSGVGVLAHEMFHTLGSPDLYHYTGNGISPVGGWDLMESTQKVPQHMLTYMKYRYGNWISSIPEIVTSGTYTLNPTTSLTNTCYKIYSPYIAEEYFIIEYRKKTGVFESSVPGSGIIIYRINSLYDGKGNAQGPPDEVYIYRLNGTDTINGTSSSANFSPSTGRTSFNKNTNPRCFLSDNTDGGLDISNITVVGNTMSFTVNILGFKPRTHFESSTTNTCIGKKVTLTDLSASFPNKWSWVITPNTFTYTDGTDSTSKHPIVNFTADGIYSVSLKASNSYGDSTSIKNNYITVGTGVNIPFIEDFETGQFKANDWSIVNPDDSFTWAITDKASNPDTTNYSAFLNGFAYPVKKAKDELISRNINLNNVYYAKMKFDVSYRRFDNKTKDSLLVYISTDCGNTFNPTALYIKSGVDLATGPNKNSSYIPAVNSDWRTDSIDLSNFAGNNVVIKFQSINDWGNNIYLDNIRIFGDTLTNFIAEMDNKVICKNDSLHFNDKSIGNFSSLNWNFPGGTPSTSQLQNPVVVYSTPGNYTASLTKSIGRYIKTSSIEFTVSDLPPVPTINQNVNELSTQTSVGYQWYDSAGLPIAGETANTFLATKSGKYYVIVKNANGCGTASAPFNFKYTGINEIGKNVKLAVYPNPNNGLFTLTISGSIHSPVSLIIQNSLGQNIYTKNGINVNGQYSELINLDKMVQGIYYLILTNTEGQTVSRVFVD